MRDCCKTGNYSYLPGLIEEAQSMGNRMEAKLYDLKDHERLLADVKKLRKEVEVLREEKESLCADGDKDNVEAVFNTGDSSDFIERLVRG
jgi:hypothetical protein